MIKWALIANKHAGTRSSKKFWEKMDIIFSNEGLAVEYFFTEKVGHARELAMDIVKKGYKKVRQKKAPRGTSIEKRPEEIAERVSFGHWEMDCVEGKKKTKKTLLVLTERLTRREIIRLMPDKTAESVVKALDSLEREIGIKKFRKMFLSITVDNGGEFSDCEGIERSYRGKSKRTTVYYCHPYSSYERGSNENQNKMVRRHYPKGTSFESVTVAEIARLEKWINNYPRQIFGFYSSEDLFKEQIKSLFSAV